MGDSNGSQLARQVRRLVETDHKVLKSLTTTTIEAIKRLGAPDETVVIPPHLYQQKKLKTAIERLRRDKILLDGDSDEEEELEEEEEREKDKAAADKAAADKAAADEAAADKAAADKAAADKAAADEAAADKAAADKAAAEKAAADKAAADKAAADKAAADRESRETSVDSTGSWDTTASSTDTHLQNSGRWRKVREKLGDDDSDHLAPLQELAEDKDCDYSSVLFFLEYVLRREPDIHSVDLTDAATNFINSAPKSQATFEADLPGNDPQLARAFAAYYAFPAQGQKEKQWWARNPQKYRDQILEGLPAEEDWDQITVAFDPDTGERNVKGRITASVAQFLDVCCPSLPRPGETVPRNNEERHFLVLRSEYPLETTRFEDSERGGRLTVSPQKMGSLRGRQKSEIKILNYSCAPHDKDGVYPRMYFFGIDKRKKTKLRAWARTTFCEYKNFRTGLDDLNDQRKACGQEKVTKEMRRLHIDSDSASEFDSDESDVEMGSWRHVKK